MPVDLNSVLFDVETRLGEFHASLGNADKASYYALQSNKRKVAMEVFFWDETDASWKDYNTNTGTRTDGFYASTIFPVWAGAHDKSPQDLSRVVAGISEHVSFLLKSSIVWNVCLNHLALLVCISVRSSDLRV